MFLPNLALSSLLLIFVSASCSKSEAKIVGFGKFVIGENTVADGYACRPDGELTYCSNNPSPKIAGHKTQTDLFFRGHKDNSLLVEILVGVWRCDAGQVGVDLAGKLGKPDKTSTKKSYWHLKNMDVIAQLPKSNGLCTIHFLDHKETQRIKELQPKAVIQQ